MISHSISGMQKNNGRIQIHVDDLSTSRILLKQIDLLFTHHYNQGKPTDFD